MRIQSSIGGDLHRAIKFIPRSVSGDTPVTIRAGHDGIEVSAHSFAERASMRIAHAVERTGTLRASVKTLAAILDRCESEFSLDLDENTDRYTLASKQFQAKLRQPIEVPLDAIWNARREWHDAIVLEAPAEELRTVMRTASGMFERSPAGVAIDATEGECSIVATDRKRMLAYTTLRIGASGSAVLPWASVPGVERFLGLAKGAAVSVAITGQVIRFAFGDAELMVRAATDAIPMWRKVIGMPRGDMFDVRVADLSEALRGLKATGDEKQRLISLEGDGLGTLTVGRGESSVQVPYSGLPGRVTLNADYLADLCGSYDDNAEICAAWPSDPSSAFMTFSGKFRWVIMPVRSTMA